jgi:hypothetical protein
MDEKELIVKSEDGGDRVSKTKTIYDAGPGEIIWKNFLAGFSRSIGGIFVYILFLFIFSGIVINVVLPKLMPLITTYTNIFKSLSPASNAKPGSIDLLNLIKQ